MEGRPHNCGLRRGARHSTERGRSPCNGEGSEGLLSNYGDAGKSRDSSGELWRHMHELLPIRQPCTVASLIRIAATPFASQFRTFRTYFLYLITHRREGAVAAWFSTNRALSEPDSSRFVSTSPLNARWNCARAPRQSTFHLESEICHATNTSEYRHFTTLLNSGDTAALLIGTRHASVKSADVHVRNAMGTCIELLATIHR